MNIEVISMKHADKILLFHAESWVEDRIDQKEALAFADFYKRMIKLGYEKSQIMKLKTSMKKMYKTRHFWDR